MKKKKNNFKGGARDALYKQAEEKRMGEKIGRK